MSGFADGFARRALVRDGAPPRRILVVRVGAMGDVLHALPAVTALRAALPEARMAWAVDVRWVPLLEGDGVVDRVFPVPTQMWKAGPLSGATVRSVTGLYRELQAETFEVAIDLQGTLRSGVIAGMSVAERRVGPARPRERMAGLFYTQTVEVRARHVVEQAAEIVAAAAEGEIRPAARVELPRDRAAERSAEELLQGLGGGGPVVLLAPAAGWGAKMWPAARFGELGRRLADEGATVLVNARRAEDPTAAEVVRASGGATRVVMSSLPELVALLRRVDLLVGGDTGPMHLAAALGRPLVALFGPTDPARNGPWEREAAGRFCVLRDPLSVTDHTRRADVDRGLARMSADAVFREAMRLLESRS